MEPAAPLLTGGASIMRRSASKPILPWPVLLAGLAVAGVALLATFILIDDGSGPAAPTLAPTPTLAPGIQGTLGYITPDGNFALIDAYGGSHRPLTTNGGVTAFAWAPNGSLVAVVEGSAAAATVIGLHPDGTEALSIAGSSDPLWSPGSDALAVSQGANLAVYDVVGNQVRTFENAALGAWSPDGTSLAFLKLAGDGLAVPVIASLGDGSETPLSADIQPAEPVFPIAWHPSGGQVAYRDRLYVLSSENTADLPGTAVQWSPDGRMLLVAGRFDATANATSGLLLDVTRDMEQTIGIYIRPSAYEIPPQLFIQKWTDWTPDGRYFLYLDPEPGRETARVFQTLYPPTQDRDRNIAGEFPDISPDGTYSVFTYQEKVWVMPLDKSVLVTIADGRLPAWQPGGQP